MAKVLAWVTIFLLLGFSAFLVARKQNGDCERVKTECSRKTGCHCQVNCDEEGRRLPPAGGRDECPSYCCEKKCKCHPPGCP